jgi:hypothetical protein
MYITSYAYSTNPALAKNYDLMWKVAKTQKRICAVQLRHSRKEYTESSRELDGPLVDQQFLSLYETRIH